MVKKIQSKMSLARRYLSAYSQMASICCGGGGVVSSMTDFVVHLQGSKTGVRVVARTDASQALASAQVPAKGAPECVFVPGVQILGPRELVLDTALAGIFGKEISGLLSKQAISILRAPPSKRGEILPASTECWVPEPAARTMRASAQVAVRKAVVPRDVPRAPPVVIGQSGAVLKVFKHGIAGPPTPGGEIPEMALLLLGGC